MNVYRDTNSGFQILLVIKMKTKPIRLAMTLGCGLVTLSRTGHAQSADPAAELQLRQQAMAALNAAIPKAETDPTRPRNTPTNLTWSLSGGQLTLRWPGYLGWYLQNSPAVGVGALWADMAGSQLVTTTNLPLNAAPGAFYRLRHP